MREIALFVEDHAHRQVIGALVQRIAAECSVAVQLDWRSVVGGHGKVRTELANYLRDLKRQGGSYPDLIVVATDANCKGMNERVREITSVESPAPMIFAIPDPHIERWLLLDGVAFKAVFGKGCAAPDRKCDRGRYKQRLVEAIRDAGTIPILGGIEHAQDIVAQIDLNRASQADRSFRRFVAETRNALRTH